MKKKAKAALAKPAKRAKLQPIGPAFEKKLRADALKLKDRLTPKERKELLKLAPRPADTRWPSEIKVGKRFRKAFKGLGEMARSIETLIAAGKPGLLQAIGITPKDELIFGERRLLGWKQSNVALTHPIPVRVIDIGAIIIGEYIENDPKLRQNFDLDESVDIVRAMTIKQREMVAAEQLARPSETRAAPGRRAKPGAAGGRIADRAAAFVGKSAKTIAKAAAVKDAAEAEPEKYGGLLDDMKRTGRADGPFKRLQVMQQTAAIRAAPPALPGNGPYQVIAVDYPWPHEPEMDQEKIDASGRSTRPYPAMAIKEGCHFMRETIAPLLAPKCTVYFWTTGFHMFYAFQLLAALGFIKPCTIATWVKDQVGRGRVLRDEGEFCIVMHRGGALIALTDDTTVWRGAGWETRENSRKPRAFYDLVARKSPTAGRYLSVFSTGGEGERWDAYGDQAEKHEAAAPAPVEPPSAVEQERVLFEFLETIAASPGLEIVNPEPWLLEALAPLVTGKRKLKLNGQGKRRLNELREGALLGWMEEAAAGRGAALPDYARAELLKRKWVTSKAATKVTSNGEYQLKQLRLDKERNDFLGTLPNDVDLLIAAYVDAISRRHAVLLNDKSGDEEIDKADDRVTTIEDRLYSLGNEVGDYSSVQKKLRAAARAPIGQVPLWGQEGVFRLDVDDRPYIVWVHAGSYFVDMSFHAESEAPFPAEKGFWTDYVDLLEQVGLAVDEQAAKFIRENIKAKGSAHRVRGKKPQTAEPVRPKTWYRMPLDWSEVEKSLPIAGGAGFKDAKKKSAKAKGPQPGGRGDESAPAEKEIPPAAPDQAAIDAFEQADLYRVPQDVVDAITARGGHVVHMENDPNGGYRARCDCGWMVPREHSLAGSNVVERAIEAHWRDVLAAAPKTAPADDYPDIPPELVRKQGVGA